MTLSERVSATLGVSAQLEPLPGGHSGLTYTAGDYVVKAVPPGQKPVGRNDMLRQARILRALAGTPVPVPRVVAVDEQEPAWFAMDFVAGEAIEPVLDKHTLPPELCRTRMLAAARILRRLHDLTAPTAPNDAFSTSTAPKDAFGAVSAPRDALGASSAPKDAFGASSAPRDALGAVSAPNDAFGAVSAPNDAFGASSAPKDAFGASSAPRDAFGASSAPNDAFGAVVGVGEELVRWSRTMRAVPVELRPRGEELLGALADDVPDDLPPVLVHGDFRLGNVLCVGEEPRAVVDWEIWSLGDRRNDLGWFLLFADHENFPALGNPVPGLPSAAELLDAYQDTHLPDLRWFEALARMKMSAIMGHNLRRHREGKHHDPDQERLPPTIAAMIRTALELLGR
jgi:aminoglycoside phosphotransferase (APT) family kinase protein